MLYRLRNRLRSLTNLKNNAESILHQLGISPSSAIQMLYSQIVPTKGIASGSSSFIQKSNGNRQYTILTLRLLLQPPSRSGPQRPSLSRTGPLPSNNSHHTHDPDDRCAPWSGNDCFSDNSESAPGERNRQKNRRPEKKKTHWVYPQKQLRKAWSCTSWYRRSACRRARTGGYNPIYLHFTPRHCTFVKI